MRAAQHISILKRAVQDEPDGFLDVDSQPPLTKLLKADEKQFSKAERHYIFKGSREGRQATQQAADDQELMERFRAVTSEGEKLHYILKGQLTKLLKRAPTLFGAADRDAFVQQLSQQAQWDPPSTPFEASSSRRGCLAGPR